MPEYDQRELSRDEFFELFVNNPQAPVRMQLWGMANNAQARARVGAVMENWLQAQIDGGTSHLWQWVFFDHPHATKSNSLDACCYWNWTGACNPPSGKVHDPRRHHCCVCGSTAHGAVGSLTSVQDGQCAELKKLQRTMAGLATSTGASLSNIVEFFGFGRHLPATIRVNVKRPQAVPDVAAAGQPGAGGPSSGSPKKTAAPAAPAAAGTEGRLASPTEAASEDGPPPTPIAYSLKEMWDRVKATCLNNSDEHDDELFTHTDLDQGGGASDASSTADEKSRGCVAGRGRVVCWCECSACRAPGDNLHDVFVGGYFPRQHDDSGVQMDPLRVVVKTFAHADKSRFVQELMTYESLGNCAPRPCAPLVMHGAIPNKRSPKRNNYMIAVLHRDQSLATFIRTHGGNLNLCLKVARGLVNAVATCHSHDIYHRDLKPANVLVHDAKNACQVELIDFEVAHVNKLQSNVTQRGTEVWEMPQRRRGDAEANGAENAARQYEARDAWTLGMVLYELLRGCTGSAPQAERDSVAAYVDQMKQDKWMGVPLIMRDCLMKQPDGSMPANPTLLKAAAAFEDKVIPHATHPLLRSLLVATMGLDDNTVGPDSAKAQLLPFERHRVNRVAREHVAVLPFATVLERLNARVNPHPDLKKPGAQANSDGLRKIRNALVHGDFAPYPGLWLQGCLRHFNKLTEEFEVTKPEVLVSQALVDASLALLP